LPATSTGAEPSGRPQREALSLLARSFAGINVRFHLVGICTLLELALRMITAQSDDSPEWALLFVFVATIYLACTFAIQGVIFSAAAGRPAGVQRFLEAGVVLFLPLLWLQIKISFLIGIPVLVGIVGWLAGTMGWHALVAADQPIDTWAKGFAWWFAPVIDGVTLLLTVYCTPVAIRCRERNAWGRPIREGLALFRRHTRAALAILALVLLTAGVGAAMHYMEEPGKEPPVPGVAQGLALLVIKWMTLAAYFGASLIVVQPTSAPAAMPRPGGGVRRDEARPEEGRGDEPGRGDEARPDEDATAPGPPA
jgi:hypothetical protein